MSKRDEILECLWMGVPGYSSEHSKSEAARMLDEYTEELRDENASLRATIERVRALLDGEPLGAADVRAALEGE